MIEKLPSARGSYLLWFYLPRGTDLTIGKLGRHHFKRGWYLYSGSAFGPGGLRARLGHHLKLSSKKHWHIDYLKESANLRSIWFCVDENHEHEWSRKLAEEPGGRFPLNGFGSSDCDCSSHLVYFSRRPVSTSIQNVLDDGKNVVCRMNVKG